MRNDDRQPLVSVVLLCHDRPQFLQHALRSVALQTYPNLEIIIINNPSPQTATIRAMVAEHPQMRLIVMDHNAGYTGGMSEGIRQSTGQYIYITEEDMVTEPGAVAAMVAYLESDPQCAIVSGIHTDEDDVMVHAGGFFELSPVYSQFIIGRNTPVPPPLCGPFCVTYVTGAMMLLRRSAVQELGGFRADFYMYHDDVEICARYLRHGRTLVIVPAARSKTLANLPTLKAPAVINFHKFKNLFATYVLHARGRVLPEFFLRYGVFNFWRHLFQDPGSAWALLRAEWWLATNMTRLLHDRRQLAASCRNAASAISSQQVS